MAEHKIITWHYQPSHRQTYQAEYQPKIENELNEYSKEGYKVLSHQMSLSLFYVVVQVLLVKE